MPSYPGLLLPLICCLLAGQQALAFGRRSAPFNKALQVAQGTLRISENRHYLVRADGSPFFYLGDTAWELFHPLNREEADHYLKNRVAKGFTDFASTT